MFLNKKLFHLLIVYDEITLNPYHQTFITFWHHFVHLFYDFFLSHTAFFVLHIMLTI